MIPELVLFGNTVNVVTAVSIASEQRILSEMFRSRKLTWIPDHCYPGVPFYLKVLGSVPLGCTTIIQQPWKEKVAIIYSCRLTDPITMNHERGHALGEMHSYW